jgi:hypothetical protein
VSALRLSVLVLVAAIGSGAAHAEPFAAGSLIIPMDASVPHGFGVAWLLAKNDIPVRVVLRDHKQALGDDDFLVPATSSDNPVYALRWRATGWVAHDLTSMGGAGMSYGGAPFVVDAADTARALAVLEASNRASPIFADVTLHIARNDFEAPVLAILATGPRPIGVLHGDPVAIGYFDDAGIPYALGSSPAYVALSLSGGLSYRWPGAPAAACSDGNCTSLTFTTDGKETRILDTVWAPDTIPSGGALADFLAAGGALLRTDAIAHRLVYDALLDGARDAGATTAVELSRSSPVVNPLTSQRYAGSFDWSATPEWSPKRGSYPWVTGHFRQHTPDGGALDWDAADFLRGAPSRNLYFPKRSGASFVLTRLGVANAVAVAQQMFGVANPTAAQLASATAIVRKLTANRALGGVDGSTPAVIEPPHGVIVGAGASRPTVAYVGARDGMLHAFCVMASGGSARAPGSCYGKPPGAELWAIVPPSVLSAMAAAQARDDWSGIDVGGVIRVGDVLDAFDPTQPTTKVWRTTLLYGTRGGAVGAINITDPDPAQLNVNASFHFLWEDTAANTTPAMGPTLGATLATPSSTTVAFVTSGTSGSASGLNLYMLRVCDGAVLSTRTLSYTKTLPPAIPSVGTVPDTAPPLPTVIDADGDGLDDAVLATDAQGDVLKSAFDASAFTGPLVKLLDASAASGCGNAACQPFGSSVALARSLAGSPSLVAFGVTGGADWADPSSRSSLWAVDATANATVGALFTRPLGTLAQGTPLRSYAQPIVVGGDLYVEATALSVGSVQQLLRPFVHGGTWSETERFVVGDTPVSATVGPAVALPAGTVVVGAPDRRLKVAVSPGRTFQVMGWYQIGE